MKVLLIILLAMSLSACGKKSVSMDPASMGIVDSLVGKKGLFTQKIVNDETCIDEVLRLELGTKDTVKKELSDSDISYCNGLRVRVKVMKLSNGTIKALGFAEGSKGKKSCLREGKDFDKTLFLGVQGTLVGEGIKISLGGHAYTSSNKLITSKSFKNRHVKLDIASFSGEMGFFEDNALKCWAIQ